MQCKIKRQLLQLCKMLGVMAKLGMSLLKVSKMQISACVVWCHQYFAYSKIICTPHTNENTQAAI